jgi:ATP-dependent RNA helicase RhlE
VPFGSLKLHPDLQRGIKELGFVKPTPIQSDAIPPAMEGRDVLAAAMTGSGKTAAFLLPILHRLISAKRGTTRALIITPTRELAAQVVQELNDLAVHTPITAAAIFGGVGMRPQEHAFRSGVDVIVATPGRLLDHLKQPYAKLSHIEYLVLDEADRMLDMGFLPDIRKVLSHIPKKRQTLFFSATMPPPIVMLTREMLQKPVTLNLERTSKPAVGITQAVYPVAQDLKTRLLLHLLERNVIREALVFTRTKHRANRLWEFLSKRGIAVGRIHGNRSQAQRTDALDGFKSGVYRVLVATDIAARGIDVEALGHVVNFDVPISAEDYVHRVGRTARAELTGEAFTFASPDESGELRAIERVVGKPLLRVTVPDFDYSARPTATFEIPIKERLAKIRAERAEARTRKEAKEAKKPAAQSHREPQADRSGNRNPDARPRGSDRGAEARGAEDRGAEAGYGRGRSRRRRSGRAR